VDDDVQHGEGAFNDQLAAMGYDIKVNASDGYSYTFTSAEVARNADIIVANTLNGEPLPADKYPLKIVGPGLFGGQKVALITSIELLNLPTIEEWEVDLVGMGNYLMTQTEFEEGVDCHGATWVDGSDTWCGLPLWLLCGWVDDDIQHGEGAFNDDMAAAGYDVVVTADDGYSWTFSSVDVAHNDDMIIANTLNGAPLPEDRYPLRLVGPDLSGKQKVSQIVEIRLVIPWELELAGASDYTMPNTEFETEVAASGTSWDDGGDIWSGLALWRLLGLVDDTDPSTFNDSFAELGYDIVVIAEDGFSSTFSSADAARNDDMIIANSLNGYPLPAGKFPLRLVGPDLSGKQKVSQVVRIELVGLPMTMNLAIDDMFINFTWLRPSIADTISIVGTFVLSEGATCDLSVDDVSVSADGVGVTIPAGSFKKWGRTGLHFYNSGSQSSPEVSMTLNFNTGIWSLLIRDIDGSAIDSYDGVTVQMTIGSVVGVETVNMRIDSLSYSAD
jgi:DMSO/TMAO reductase YedYZ molybdopterin-dependent catalytic subunit